jgi:hypothetical protein
LVVRYPRLPFGGGDGAGFAVGVGGFCGGGFFAGGADAGQELGGGFVGAAFFAGEFGFGGDEFTAESFRQYCHAKGDYANALLHLAPPRGGECTTSTKLAVRPPKDSYSLHDSQKGGASCALIGTGLLAILLAAHFILDILNAARGLVPAIRVLTSLIHAFASLSVAVFFYVFHKEGA